MSIDLIICLVRKPGKGKANRWQAIVETEKSLLPGLNKAEPKRVVRGEEWKPDSRPSRSIPATWEVELKKLWQNKLLQNQQLLNPGRRTTGSGSSYLISSGFFFFSFFLFLIQFFLTSLPSLPFCLIVSPRASSGFSQYGCFLGLASLSVKTVCPRPSYWFTNPPFSTARCHRFWTLRRVSLGVVLSTTCNVYLLL